MPRVSDLTEATSMSDTDMLYAVIGGNSRKIQRGNATAGRSYLAPQTAVTASGQTALQFSAIPAWVNRLTVTFNGLSTNGASDVQIQIGDSGGYETTGYLGSSSVIGANSTESVASTTLSTGFLLELGGNAALTNGRHGSVTLTRIAGTNIWSAFGGIGLSERATRSTVGGTKELSATLDRLQVTTVNGTDTFDAGSVGLTWE